MNNNTRHAILDSRCLAPPDEWILYLGATHHLTSTSHNLKNPCPYLAGENVTVGNGKQLPISTVGSNTLLSIGTQYMKRYKIHFLLSLNAPGRLFFKDLMNVAFIDF